LKRFVDEVNRIQSDEEAKEFDFSGFIFPDFTPTSPLALVKPVSLRDAVFQGSAWFRSFRFNEADFENATFEADANFSQATFGTANFDNCRFKRRSSFRNAEFDGRASFKGATFAEVDFLQARFAQDTSFLGAEFGEKAIFAEMSLLGSMHFGDAKFQEDAHFGFSDLENGFFGGAVFEREANFGGITVQERLHFDGTDFKGVVNFEDAEIQGKLIFESGEIGQTAFRARAFFDRAVIRGGITFKEVRVENRISFRDAVALSKLVFQDVQVTESGILDLRYAVLREDRSVEFLGHKDVQEMRRVRLLHTDVTRIRFRNVSWWGPGKDRVIFDERVLRRDLSEVASSLAARGKETSASGPYRGEVGEDKIRIGHVHEGTSYESVEALYRDLRYNYEEGLRYSEAGDFYIREMEMKRLGRAPGEGLSAWLQRNFSIISLYRVLSCYGESYARAGAWTLGSILAFGALRVGVDVLSGPISIPSILQAFVASFWAFFQVGATTWIDQLERLWAILLFALFFLALRRRLRR
jgi:uncharacterized protein YjbI with pentapeptide repeats